MITDSIFYFHSNVYMNPFILVCFLEGSKVLVEDFSVLQIYE